MLIFVNFPTGHKASIEAEGTDTVDTFIQNLFQIEFDRLQNINDFRLFFSGTRLDTELAKTLSEFNIQKESELNIQLINKWNMLKEKRFLDKRLEQLEQNYFKLEQLGQNYFKLEQLVESLFRQFRVITESQNQGGGYISKRKKRKTKRRKKR